jgi:hypothetical protein
MRDANDACSFAATASVAAPFFSSFVSRVLMRRDRNSIRKPKVAYDGGRLGYRDRKGVVVQPRQAPNAFGLIEFFS